MALLLTFLGIFKYIIIGACIVFILQKNEYLDKRLTPAFVLFFSFLLGTLFSSIVLHLGFITHTLPFTSILLWFIAGLCLIEIFYLHLNQLRSLFGGSWIIGAVFAISYFWQSLLLSFQPVIANDARGIWLLKTKILLEGSVEFSQYLQSTIYSYSHTDYPISMPLLYTDLLRPMGFFWEPALGIFSFTFFFILLVGMYGAIRHFTNFNKAIALFIVMAIFFTPEYLRQGWAGLSDVPLSLVMFGTILSLQLLKQYTESKNYVLPIALAAFAATIKNEGQSFLLITVLCCAIFFCMKLISDKVKLRLPWKETGVQILILGISFLPLLLWKFTTSSLGVTNDVINSPNIANIVTRIPVLINEILPRLFDGYRFGILFITSLLLLILPVNNKKTINWSVIILGQTLVYLLIYLITPHDLKWHISTSFSRLLLHLLPSIYLLTLAHRSTKSIV